MSNVILFPAPKSPQSKPAQATERKARSARRRASQLHRGAQDVLDAAIEARRDSDEPAREFEVERAGAIDIFAWRTRRLVRELQGAVRALESRVMRLEGRAA